MTNRIMELAQAYAAGYMTFSEKAHYAALQAEVEKQDEMLTLSGKVSRKLAEELEDHRQQLRKEQLYVQELADDAARYRWLRERLYKDGADVCASVSNAYDIYSGSLSEIFDAAIDAAMKEQPVKPKAQRLAELNAEIAAHLREDV